MVLPNWQFGDLITADKLNAIVQAINNVPQLVGGKLDPAALPDLGVIDYLGPASSESAMLGLAGQKGDWCIRSDSSTAWIITGNPTQLSGWTQLPLPAAALTKTAADGAYTALTDTAPTITANGPVVVGKHNPVDATSGVITVTLPAPATKGLEVSVEKIDNVTSNTVTISGTIRGNTATINVSLYREGILFRSDSSGSWRPIADHKTLSSLKVFFDGVYVPRWQPNTAYIQGQNVLLPDGTVGTAKTAFTSGAAFAASNWTMQSATARINTSSSAAFSIADQTGKSAVTVRTDGSVDIPALNVPAGSVGDTSLTAAVLARISSALRGDSRFAWVVRDAIGAVGTGVTQTGSFVGGGIELAMTTDSRIAGGFTDGQRMSELVIDPSGRVPTWSAQAIVSRGLTNPITAIGDSTTELDWTAPLSALLGLPVLNAGWGGQTAPEIAARVGATKSRLTFPSNTIPASGQATITVVSGDPNPVGGNIVAGRYRAGFVSTPGGPVRGQLSRDSNGTYFTREIAGTAIILTWSVAWVADEIQTHRSDTFIIWVGRNAPALTTNIASVQAMVNYQRGGLGRYLVLQVLPWVGSNSDEADLNLQLSQNFPEAYVPIADWLRTDAAAAAAGVTLTSDDRTDIASGYTPRSLRLTNDPVHLNPAGRTAVAYRLAQEFTQRGWTQ